MDKAQFLYALLHDDSVDFLSIICQHILRVFRVLRHRIGLPYACLIHHLVTFLGVTFSNGLSGHVCRPIGHVTISQSRSHVTSSFAPIEPADLGVPADTFCDPSSVGPLHILASTSQPTFPSDDPSSSTSIPPFPARSMPRTSSASFDPSIALMYQMSVLIE